MVSANQRWTEQQIAHICARLGITRDEFECGGWTLNEDQPAALDLLNDRLGKARSDHDTSTVIVPEGLPGAGKCYGELTDDEVEMLTILDLQRQALVGDDEPEGDAPIEPASLQRGWKYDDEPCSGALVSTTLSSS